jgi:hypothetical protein
MTQHMVIANCDISAQEPTFVTLLSKEPSYTVLYRNRILREKKLLKYLDPIVADYFHLDPNVDTEKSRIYWSWLTKFDWNWLPLFEFNDLIAENKEDQYLPILENWIQEINQMMEEQLQQ